MTSVGQELFLSSAKLIVIHWQQQGNILVLV